MCSHCLMVYYITCSICSPIEWFKHNATFVFVSNVDSLYVVITIKYSIKKKVKMSHKILQSKSGKNIFIVTKLNNVDN